MALGLLLLVGGGGFFLYTWRANSNLDTLNVTTPPQAGGDPGALAAQRPAATSPPLGQPPADRGLTDELIAAQSVYPGEALNPVFWANPHEAESAYGPENPIVEEFTPVAAAERNSLPLPLRIAIPAIGLESEVMGLRILDLGSSRAYETPKDVVGHIPETASPGERGAAWFFGHLESPVAGEGSVFAKLPDVPDLLRQGPVYATVDNGVSEYLYKLTSSRVAPAEELSIRESPGASISLVTCVPRFQYDHRLVVTGELVGVRAKG